MKGPIMPTLTHQQVLHILEDEWATYVDRFQKLSPDGRTEFLKKQGYNRFADLLAHIVDWWEVGYDNIIHFLMDPDYQPPERNVDEFNAEAISKVRGLSEDSVIRSFEEKRTFLLRWIEQLPKSAFNNEKVAKQFDMELIGHFSEHEIPG